MAAIPNVPALTGNSWTCNGGEALITQSNLEAGVKYSLTQNGDIYPIDNLYYWIINEGQAVGGDSYTQALNLPAGSYVLTAESGLLAACSADTTFVIVDHITNFGLSFGATNSFCQVDGQTDLFDLLQGDYNAVGNNEARWILTRNGAQQPVEERRYIATADMAAGFYEAILTVGDDHCDTTMHTYIIINARPEGITLAADTTVCNGLPVTYIANQSGLTYEWYLNDTKVDGVNGHEFTQSYAADGMYTVRVKGINADGCFNTSEPITTEALTVTSELRFNHDVPPFESCPYKLLKPINDLVDPASSPQEYDNLGRLCFYQFDHARRTSRRVVVAFVCQRRSHQFCVQNLCLVKRSSR